MRRLLIALLIFPSVVLAQENLERCIRPNERIVQADTAFFESFSAGGSVDLPAAELGRFDQFIRSTTPAQHLCFRGTADTVRWQARYSQREWYRVNHSLAESRAHWAWERAGRRGLTLEPFLFHPRRGVYVYRLVVETIPAPRPTPRPPRPTRRPVEEEPPEERPQVIEIRPYRGAAPQPTQPTPSRPSVERSVPVIFFSGGFGFTAVSVADLEFSAPTATVGIGSPTAEFTLTGGWRPRSANKYGERYEAIAAGELTVFPPRSYLGFALGALGAWRAVEKEDEYLERVYGPLAGLRLKLGSGKLSLVFGADATFLNVSVFGQEGTSWEWGFSPLARMQFTF